MSTKQRIPVIIFSVWFTVITAIMLLNRVLNLEVFYVLALICLVVVVEMVDPVTVKLQYMRRIKYVIAVGFLLFGYLIASKILEIVAS